MSRATTTHARLGVLQLAADRVEANRGQAGDEDVGGDDQGRHRQYVLRADATKGGNLRLGGAGRGRGSRAKLLEAEFVGAGEVAQVRCERRALQVRQGASDGVGPSGIHGGPQRAFRADEDAARDEQLGHVYVERGLRRAEAGRRQVDHQRFAVHDQHVAQIQPAVRDPGVVQHSDLPAQLHEQLVAHLLGPRVLQRREIGLEGDQQRVAVGADARGDHPRHAHTGLRGHQRRDRLVLDLFEASDGCAPGWVAVGEKAPATREALRVLCVSAQDADLQRSSVVAVPEVVRGAALLALADPQVADVHAK